MIKNHLTRRTIAIFFLLNFLSTLIPYNGIYANNNGPNAPEAASFEPVDATDMVNLLTGDFTYVLPLLNVPSPEGGYPISLAYHAGIAMDQEASWVGLGWTLNPGAINRNVNGAPDDYFESNSSDFFYSNEEEVRDYHASIGYSSAGGVSAALSLSWGSNKSLGGTISAGYGFKLGKFDLGVNGSIGSNGVGLGAGIKIPSGLSFGASVHSSGSFGGNIGYSSNGQGFSISASSSGSFGANYSKETANNDGSIISNSYGVDFSSGGMGLTLSSSKSKFVKDKEGNVSLSKVSSTGVGLSFLNFNNTLSMGDYTTSVNSWTVGFIVPLGFGTVNLGFGKNTVKYSLYKSLSTSVTGVLNFDKSYDHYAVSVSDGEEYCITTTYGTTCSKRYTVVGYLSNNYTSQDLSDLIGSNTDYKVEPLKDWEKAAMDIFEIPLEGDDISDEKNILAANPTLPNYDKFTVQAQGLSGSISPRVYENGALFGFSDDTTRDGDRLEYVVNNKIGVNSNFKFTKKAHFYFENEISTYIETPVAKFENTPIFLNSYIGKEYSENIGEEYKSENVLRRKTSNFIEYYTNEEIANGLYRIDGRQVAASPLSPNNAPFGILDFGFSQNFPTVDKFFEKYFGEHPRNGIGAFKITAADGKTYHYTLPVYNHEIIQRSYGTMKYQDGRDGIKPENEAYFEKKQLEPFATHWLLTGVTGPDYIDVNNNNKLDKEDYGYWVGFDYGKYSSSFVWSGSYGKEYSSSPEDDNAKSWAKGRKEIYYLDKVRTRTHTAVFVKSERQDAKSVPFTYASAKKMLDGELKYENRFTIPEQRSLKLDKILLYKGEPFISQMNNVGPTVDIEYDGELSYGNNIFPKYAHTTPTTNLRNVIDSNDNISANNPLVNTGATLVKTIEFENNHYDLVKGTPYSDGNGRLTLRGVAFKGKSDNRILPPYKFAYNNNNYNFNIEDKDGYGFYKNDNSLWSLREITTPTGGKIQVEYENHKVQPVLSSKIKFYENSEQFKLTIIDNNNFKITSSTDLGFQVGEELKINIKRDYCQPFANCSEIDDIEAVVTISSVSGKIAYASTNENLINEPTNVNYKSKTVSYKVNNPLEAGGSRVKTVSTIDENGRYYSMEYQYGKNQNGIGYITYVPFATDLNEELPYSSELPFPMPMYEYVKTLTYTRDNSSSNVKNNYGIITEYGFNVITEKDPNKAKFGDFYEIEKSNVYGGDDASRKLRSYLIKDNLGAIGQLLEVKRYNQKSQLLSQINNNYYLPGTTPNKIGQTQESYQSYKKITFENNNIEEIGIATTRINYPNLLRSSTELKNFDSYTSEFSDLDPITGQAKKVYSYSSTGVKFLTEGIQAFRKYPDMGSKVDNVYNKNMLTQSAGSKTFIFRNNEWKEIEGSATTWSKNWIYPIDDATEIVNNDVWRKQKTYVWNGQIDNEGVFINFTDFNYNSNSSNTQWKKNEEITMYDQFSNIIEVKDLNNNYASVKMGDNYSKVIATSDAAYNETYYSGAEYNNGEYKWVNNSDNNPLTINFTVTGSYEQIGGDYFSGGIKSFGYKNVENADGTSDAHTGNYLVEINQGEKAFEVNIPSNSNRNTPLKQRFKLSVWVKKGGEDSAVILLNNNPVLFNSSEKVYAGNWVLLNGYVTIPQSGTNIGVSSTSGMIQLDDFRLHPMTSNMMSYVYNDYDEVSYITSANGLSINYIYDDIGRLIETKTETVDKSPGDGSGGFKTSSTNSYNYKRNNQ